MRDAIILIFANKQDLPDGKWCIDLPLLISLNTMFCRSHETTRNTRETRSNSNKRQKLVCATVVCHHWRWSIRGSDVVNVKPQIMRINKLIRALSY